MYITCTHDCITQTHSVSYLLVALLAAISVGALQQVTLDKGVQRLKQVLLVADVHVQGCERLLSGVPVQGEGEGALVTVKGEGIKNDKLTQIRISLRSSPVYFTKIDTRCVFINFTGG